MKTVYAVESGDYSDYTVHALFETRELAEAYIAALVAADLAQEKRMWGYDEPSRLAGDYSVTPYQLWDTVPVFDPDVDIGDVDHAAVPA